MTSLYPSGDRAQGRNVREHILLQSDEAMSVAMWIGYIDKGCRRGLLKL